MGRPAAADLGALRARRADQRIDATMMRQPLGIVDMIDRAERFFPDREVVSRFGASDIRRSSWRQVADEARRLAGGLVAGGLRRGDRVATLMWNHTAHLITYFAAAVAGGVLHTLNPRLSAAEIAYIVADAGDRVVIVDDDLLPLWREVEALVPGVATFVHARTGARGPAAGRDLAALLEHEPLTGRPDGFDENEAASICYTSGTTGNPKGVVYSHRSVVLHALAICAPDAMDLSNGSVICPITPMFHVNAWGMPYAAMMLGAKLVLPGPQASAEELLDLFAAEAVTYGCGVPTVWIGVLDALERSPGRWQLAAELRIDSGGSAPPPSMFRRFDRLGIRLQTGWGMTETSPIATQTWVQPHCAGRSYEDLLAVRTCQGLPLPFIDMRIADGDGRELPWDGKTSGELQVRGPWVTGAYIGHPAPIPATTADGWLRTGDVAMISPDGYMHIVDRLKDLVKSGGEWISSIDMENALMAHPDIVEAAVIALSDPRWSERPLAVVVPAAGATVTLDEVRRHLSAGYPKWQLPDHVAVIDALPKTGTGKFDKKALRAHFNAHPPD